MADDFDDILGKLLNDNDSLIEQLERSTSIAAAAAVISNAAQQQQLELDSDRLVAWLQQDLSQEQTLSHDELEEIAAGKGHYNTRTMGMAATRILKHITKPKPAVFGPQVK